jgi:hypothetical protein
MEAPDSADSYVLCIDNGGYPESLEVRKLYAVLPDERAAAISLSDIIEANQIRSVSSGTVGVVVSHAAPRRRVLLNPRP